MWIKVERSTRLWGGRTWVGVLCLACLGELAGASTVAAAELPPEVRQALQNNVQALSPISVSWTEQLASDMPVQDWLKMVNDESYVDEFELVRATYAWQDGMSYSHVWQNKADITDVAFLDANGEVRTRPDAKLDNLPRMVIHEERACDLKRVFVGTFEEATTGTAMVPVLFVDSFDAPKIYASETYIFFDPLYFREAGFVLPRTAGMHRSGAKSLPLALIEEGARVTKVEEMFLDGQKCVLLELEDKDLRKRFWLDPTRGHAVCRREFVMRSGQVAEVSRMTDFAKFEKPDIWLPKRCDVVYYTWPTIPEVVTEKPLARRTFVVRGIDKKAIPVERFCLKYTMPGTDISDSTLPQAKELPRGIVDYKVPPDIEDLDAAIQCAIEGQPFVPRALREHNKALMERAHPRTRSVRLTEDQRKLVESMAEGRSSARSRPAQIRVAVFKNELSLARGDGGLGEILDSEPTCTWKSVSGADIRAGALDHFDVVIFPGGGSAQHTKALQDKGRQATREFVRAGGGYVGICAGAFLAAAATAESDSLGLVNARSCTGEMGKPRGGPVKIELTDAGERVFGEFPGLMDAVYGGGPILSPAEKKDLPGHVPLALYRTETWSVEPDKNRMVDTPSIVAAQFGSGRVLIFSPHPEAIDETQRLLTRAVLAVAWKPTDR